MDPCDPKTNVSVARAAVIDNLLVPSKIVANLTQTELCDLLKTCGTKQLPEPPLMTRPKRVGKYMISIYIRSPLNVKETEILLRSKPNPSKLKSIAEKLGVFVNGENLKQRILSKLSADGIPEPIKYSATDRFQKNVPVLNNTAQSFKLANTPKNSNFNNTAKNSNGGNRVNNGGNRVNNVGNRVNNGGNRVNGGVNRVNGGVNRVNGGVNRVNGGVNRVNNGGNRKFNISTSKHRLTLTPNNFKPSQQPQYALPSGKNKRIVAGPWDYARGPSYQIASREQQQLMKQYQTSRNATRYGVPYGGGSSNRFMRERMALNQEKQKLALNMRKAQQNKELESKRREFNERVKKLSNMEKQLANKLKAAPQAPAPTPRAPAPVLPAPVPPADMNKIKRNLANAQKIIIELKQKPQNAAIVAKLNNAKARVLVMNNQVAITQAVTVPKVVEVAKKAKELPEEQKQQAVQQVIAELKPVATTNAQTQYVAKLEKLVAEKKTSEALNSIEKETNVQFDSEKVRKMKNLLGKAASGVASGVAGGASYLYRKVTRTLTIEEKRALLNKLLKNSSVSNANKVKIKAVQNLTNFPKMKSAVNVTEYYNKLMKNKNYAEIAAIAEQYGGIRGSLANLRKIGVNKKDERLVELINRFQGANGGAARVSKATNVNRNARLQEVIIELEKSNKPTINRSELEKLLKQFKLDPKNILANVPGNEVKKESAVAAVQTEAAGSLNSGPGSKEAPVSPNLENFARRWYAYIQRPNKRIRNENLERIARNIGENFKKVEKLIEEMNMAPEPKKPTNVPTGAINKLVNVGLNISEMLVNNSDARKKAYRTLALKIHPNKGGNPGVFSDVGSIYERSSNPELLQKMREYFKEQWALRNAMAFFDKLKVLRSNYNSMKARKGRPGNKVNEKGKPINQLIKNYEQALINLNRQANAKPHASIQAADLMNVLKRLGPVKYRQNPQYRALPAAQQKNMNEALELLFVLPKGTEETYKSKLQVASLINKEAAASVQSQLLAKINIQGEPTPAMYGVAEIELNNIILKFKKEGENLLNQGSCPTMGDPASIAALRKSTGNTELNNLRRRLANVCNGGGSKSTNSGTQTNVNQSVVQQVARQMSLYRNMMQQSHVPKEAVKKMWEIQEARFVANKAQLKTNHNTAINNLRKLSAELEKQIEELKKKPETREFGTGTNNLQVLESLKKNIKELPTNLQTRILALVPEGATNNQEARVVLGKIEKVLGLIKMYPTGSIAVPKFSNFKLLNKRIQVLQTGLNTLEAVRTNIPDPKSANLSKLRSGIKRLTQTEKSHEPLFRNFRQALENEVRVKEKTESNQVAKTRENARIAFNQRVPKGLTGNNGSGTSSNTKGSQKNTKEEGNASTSSPPNFNALRIKAAQNRANRNEANRLVKEKAEANRLAKEKAEAEAARKKKLKKQLSNAWSKNLNTFGPLKNPLFNDLQSYINGGSQLSTNVSKYAKNNNPAQHPMLLKRLNSFIASSSNSELKLDPVKKLQSQLKELVNAEANKQLKISQELAESKKKENARLRAEANLAKQAEREREKAEAEAARRVKAESNEAIAKKKKNFNSWFNGLSAEDQKALKKLGNINNLNFAKKSLEVIRRKSTFNAFVNELVSKTKNHGISKKGVEKAKQLYNGMKPYNKSSFEAQIHNIFKKHVVSIYGQNRYQVAIGKKNTEVVQSSKKKVNPTSPSTEEVTEEIGEPKIVKPRIKAPTEQPTKRGNTTYLQRIGATAGVQPQPPTKVVSRANRVKAAQRKNKVEPGPPLA